MIYISLKQTIVVLCAIWHHLHNLKNVQNTHRGVLLLIKFQALKVTLLHGCFSRFLNCTNSTKSREATQWCKTGIFYTKLVQIRCSECQLHLMGVNERTQLGSAHNWRQSLVGQVWLPFPHIVSAFFTFS